MSFQSALAALASLTIVCGTAIAQPLSINSFQGQWRGTGTLITISESSPTNEYSKFPCQNFKLQILQTAKTLQIKKLSYSCTFNNGEMTSEIQGPIWQIAGNRIYHLKNAIGKIDSSGFSIHVTDEDNNTRLDETYQISAGAMTLQSVESNISDGKILWDLRAKLIR